MNHDPAWLDLEALKRSVSIERVLSHFGVNGLRRSGDELIGPCPLHGGDNPTAFHANVRTHLWYCHTQCGGGGTVLDLVMGLLHTDVRGAAEYLQTHVAAEAPLGEALEPVPALGPRHEVRPVEVELTLDREHPYLRERRIGPETAEAFGVGYCQEGRLAGQVALELRDAQGALVGYLGRRLDEDEPKYRFPSGFAAGRQLYNLWRQEARDDVIVVEGPFDVMRLAQAGYPKTVALLGSRPSGWQVERLREFRRVVLLLDGDPAGQAGAQACAERLRAGGADAPEVIEARWPEGTDPASLSEAEVREVLATAGAGVPSTAPEPETAQKGRTAEPSAAPRPDATRSGRRVLTPDERWAILEESYRTDERVEDVARRHGVHRTTVYDIRQGAEAILKDRWSAQRPGRPASGVPQSYSDLNAAVQSQQQELERLREQLAAKEKECLLKDVRIEFLEFGRELDKKRAAHTSSTARRRRT
jgi:DNA primase